MSGHDAPGLTEWEKDEFARIAGSLKDPRRCRRCGCPANMHEHYSASVYSASVYCGRCGPGGCPAYRRPRSRLSYFLLCQLRLSWIRAAAAAWYLVFFAVLCVATVMYGNGHLPVWCELLMWPSFFASMALWAVAGALQRYRGKPGGRM